MRGPISLPGLQYKACQSPWKSTCNKSLLKHWSIHLIEICICDDWVLCFDALCSTGKRIPDFQILRKDIVVWSTYLHIGVKSLFMGLHWTISLNNFIRRSIRFPHMEVNSSYCCKHLEGYFLPQKSMAILRPLFAPWANSRSLRMDPLGPPVLVLASYVPASCHLHHKPNIHEFTGKYTRSVEI